VDIAQLAFFWRRIPSVEVGANQMNFAGEDVAVEHMMPGRIRLRFRSRQGETEFQQQGVSFLSEFSLVEGVDANSLTGSVLIQHSASPEQLAFLAAQSVFRSEAS
jgi:hypothetical protein